MNESRSLDYKERGDYAVLTVHRRARGLILSEPEIMQEAWALLHRAAASQCKVLLISVDQDALTSERLDEAWADILQASAGKQEMPPQIRAIQSNIRKLIDYHQRTRLLTIGAFSGTIDLDLFGLLAIAHYRICAADGIIQNQTLDRVAPPGGATVWFLSQMLGIATTIDIYLNEKSLTANDALDLKLVNDIAPSGELRRFAEEKAEYFASKSRIALSTLMISLSNAPRALPDYLSEIGTGFEAVFREI